jgi:hypothetical protein
MSEGSGEIQGLEGDASLQRLPLSTAASMSSPLGEAEFPLTIFSMWCVYHMAWYMFPAYTPKMLQLGCIFCKFRSAR